MTVSTMLARRGASANPMDLAARLLQVWIRVRVRCLDWVKLQVWIIVRVRVRVKVRST